MSDNRKLASIQRIDALDPIPNADKIEVASILGYKAVVKKGEFNVGDKVVYCECDSILPFMPWSEFLRDKNRPDKPIRIKTVKLRGQISQGVVFPLSILPAGEYQEGLDVTESLGVTKYEPYIPAQLAGVMKGNFPSFIPKTDCERIQSYPRLFDELDKVMLYVSEKADGSSFTCYFKDAQFGVCSRNLELAPDEGRNNMFWKMAYQYDLEAKLTKFGRNIAIQGEVVGEGIQKNRMGLTGNKLLVFDIYDIDAGKYLDYSQFVDVVNEVGLERVKCFTDGFVLLKNEHNMDYLINMTKGNYEGTNQQREGLVYRPVFEKESHALHGRSIFKVINPNYLLESEKDE